MLFINNYHFRVYVLIYRLQLIPLLSLLSAHGTINVTGKLIYITTRGIQTVYRNMFTFSVFQKLAK